LHVTTFKYSLHKFNETNILGPTLKYYAANISDDVQFLYYSIILTVFYFIALSVCMLAFVLLYVFVLYVNALGLFCVVLL